MVRKSDTMHSYAQIVPPTLLAFALTVAGGGELGMTADFEGCPCDTDRKVSFIAELFVKSQNVVRTFEDAFVGEAAFAGEAAFLASAAS